MKISRYKIETYKKGINLKIAVVSDLHARPYKKVVEALERIKPDAILMPGDIVEIAADYMNKRNQNGLNFLNAASRIAPCYYCYGNHEIFYSHAKFGHPKTPDPKLESQYLDLIKSYGINMVNDRYVELVTSRENDNRDEVKLLVGGLVCGRDMDPALNMPLPNLDFVSEFNAEDGLKILLCHYPHYYEKYFKGSTFDLILSGHAHGGQWRFFGRAIYAPHQGILPQYTSGIYDNRHIISRGASNNIKPIPRLFNPCEVLEIRIESKA